MDIQKAFDTLQDIEKSMSSPWFLSAMGITSLVIILTPKKWLTVLLSLDQISSLQQLAAIILLAVSAVFVLKGISGGYDAISKLINRRRNGK